MYGKTLGLSTSQACWDLMGAVWLAGCFDFGVVICGAGGRWRFNPNHYLALKSLGREKLHQ